MSRNGSNRVAWQWPWKNPSRRAGGFLAQREHTRGGEDGHVTTAGGDGGVGVGDDELRLAVHAALDQHGSPR